jgi:hypothetical protein
VLNTNQSINEWHRLIPLYSAIILIGDAGTTFVLYFQTKNSKDLRIDRNFCLVHEEITSISLYTPCVQPDWGYFEWTEQIISINTYKLIQTFFAMILKNIFICSK